MSFIPGANVGPYRIVEQAERNGVATTYAAYQPSLGRYVSMVVMPSIDPDDLSQMRQLRRQVELALGLRHPNILSVLDHGEHLGVPFVVTEQVEAEPLSERLGTPWPLTEVTRVMRPIAAALDYAHQQGVVHGELRPSAVLLKADGTPILSGFGVMTRRITAPAAVASGKSGRRPASALEDIAEAQAADRRGMALIAYEMLTGRSVDVDPAELGRPLLPNRLGSPLLAAPIELALRRELAGDDAERYPSASAFVADLKAPTGPDRPVATPMTPPPIPVATTVAPSLALPSSDSGRRVIAVASIVAALLVLGALVFLLRGGEASRPIASPVRTPSTDVSGVGAVPGAASAGSGTTTGGTAATDGPGTTAGGAAPRGSTAAGAAGTGASSVATGAQPAPAGAAGAGSAPDIRTAATGPVPTPDVAAVAGATAPPTPGPAAATPGTAGTTRLPVTWRVVGDPSGRWQLDEQGRVVGRTETGASVVLFPEQVDDVSFSAMVSTTSCQATLVFRAQDDENLKMAIYIPDGLPNPGTTGGGVWLYQRVEGLDLPIKAVRPYTVRPVGEPVQMRIVTSGPQIAIFLNDQPALQAVDTAPRSGRLGLMVYATSGRQCEATFGDVQR